jgi:crotonobetainyl-CoA:carnitine CoA-transferase CaiB-like acyl-CoA transferase
MSCKPLEGIRVLDFGTFIAAPYCAALLADLGAEVIRIERPGGSDDRFVMPVSAGGEGALFIQLNRNKTSLTLNLGHPRGSEVVRRLVESCDVVVVNMPPKVLSRLGLDYSTLSAIRPDVVLVSVSAFGPQGPEKDSVGFDGIGQAMSGAIWLTGLPGRPFRSATSYVDYGTGLAAAYGALAAILERQRTGKGRHVEASLLGTALTIMNPVLIEEASGARSRKPIGNRSPIAGPSDLFAARDGWIMVQVIGQDMFERWATLVEAPELIDDPRFADDFARGENGETLSERMASWCAQRTTQECLATLREARIPAAPVLTPAQALDAPQNREGGFFTWVDHPGLSASVPIVQGSVRLTGDGESDCRPAPGLGQHTAQILNSVGYSSAESAELRAEGVV